MRQPGIPSGPPTLFVCYRRHDSPRQAFINEFEKFFIQKLAPYVEKRLVSPMRLWWDERIDSGDYGDAVIEEAIQDAMAGLVLMSDSLLNSDYIANREFPALMKRHLDPHDRFQLHWLHLRPTIISDIGDRLPGLQNIQAINDPSEPALQASWNPNDRSHPEFESRFCATVWERLSKKLNAQLLDRSLDDERSYDLDQAQPGRQNEAAMSRLDMFHDQNDASYTTTHLPQVNPAWSGVGDRLADTKGRLLMSTVATTGLVSPGATLGMYGEGGVGKTVLAIQLVRDLDIAAMFKNGRFWATLGRQPQLATIYDELLAAISADYAARPKTESNEPPEIDILLSRPRVTTAQVQRVVREILEATNTLLVVDDVWEIGHVRDVIPLRGRSRVLITSRFPGIVRGLGGDVVQVDRLSEDEARTFLLETPSQADTLPKGTPEEIDRIIEAASGLLIQLALYRGMARSGIPWAQIATRIERHRSEVGDGELAEEYRAQAVSIGEIQENGPVLPAGDAECSLYELLLALAVFPEDAAVPISFVEQFWATTPEQTGIILEELVSRRWILYAPETATLSLHDVTRDYLRLRGSELRRLNRDLLDRYRKTYGSTKWSLVAGQHSYLRDNLGYHMTSGELQGEWVRTVLDPDWVALRICGDGISAALDDINTAIKYADWVSPDEARSLTQLLFTVKRYAQLLLLAAREKGRIDLSASLQNVASTLLSKWQPPISTGIVRLRARFDLTASVLLDEHVSGVRCLDYSNDGSRLVTGSFDECLCIWDTSSGKMLIRLVGHTASICMATWSPDDAYILSASYDSYAIVWDAQSGAEIARLEGHSAPVRAIQWRPGHRQIATGSSDGTVKLWDSGNWEPIDTIAVSKVPIWSIAWSPSGDRLGVATTDGTIRIIEPHTGSQILTIPGTEDPVWSIAWQPEGECLAAGGFDGAIRLWDTVTGALLGSLYGHSDQVNVVSWSSNGEQLASGSCDGSARLWNPNQPDQRLVLVGHEARVPALDWSPDGVLLATGGYDGSVRLWETGDGQLHRRLNGATKWIWSIDCNSDGQQIATAGYDGVARIWSSKLGTVVSEFEAGGGPLWSIKWSSDDQTLAIGNDDGTLRLWNARSGVAVACVEAHDGPVWSVEWSPDGTHIATAGADGALRVWSALGCALSIQLSGDGPPIWTMSWSRDGSRLAAGSYDGRTRVWDTATGRQLQDLSHPGTRIWSAGWTPETAGRSRQVSRQPHEKNLPHPEDWTRSRYCRVLAVAWSPDAQHLITSRDDGLAIVWNADTSESVAFLEGHSSWVWGADWSASGDFIITAGEEGSVRLWDGRTYKLLDVVMFGTSINAAVISREISALPIVALAHGVAWTAFALHREALLGSPSQEVNISEGPQK